MKKNIFLAMMVLIFASAAPANALLLKKGGKLVPGKITSFTEEWIKLQLPSGKSKTILRKEVSPSRQMIIGSIVWVFEEPLQF